MKVCVRSSLSATWSIVAASVTSIAKLVAVRSAIAPADGSIG